MTNWMEVKHGLGRGRQSSRMDGGQNRERRMHELGMREREEGGREGAGLTGEPNKPIHHSLM